LLQPLVTRLLTGSFVPSVRIATRLSLATARRAQAFDVQQVRPVNPDEPPRIHRGFHIGHRLLFQQQLAAVRKPT
jgi:hypothetical protein